MVLLISVALLANYNEGGVKPASLSRRQPNGVLPEGVKELERYGEFDFISAEIISCALDKLTEVLLDRAKEWKATSIYVALDEEKNISEIQPTKKESGWLSWLGFKTKPA